MTHMLIGLFTVAQALSHHSRPCTIFSRDIWTCFSCPCRWNARQTLINLSMVPDLLPSLQLYNVPNFIHGANVPTQHFDRPFPSSGIIEDELTQLPAHLEAPALQCKQELSAGGIQVT